MRGSTLAVAVGLRRFTTSRASLAFRRSTGKGQDSPTTPRKSAGEFRWYEDAAPHSNLHLSAPDIIGDADKASSLNIKVPTADSVPALAPGELVSWPSDVEAPLTHLGSYKPMQQSELFKSRVSVVRAATAKLWSEGLRPGAATVVTGGLGTGKTTLLSQAHAAARIQKFGLIHISQANKLLDGSTDAVFNQTTNKWDQPMFVARLWKKTVKANRGVLSAEAAAKPVGRTLRELVDLFGTTPVLVTVDNVNAISSEIYARNTNENNERLYYGDLEVASTLLELAAKPSESVRFIAATSGNYRPISWTGHAYASLREFDPEFAAKLGRAERIELNGLSEAETRAYVDYLRAAEVTAKEWTELYQFGNGNPRAILAAATNYAY